jgi:integrase
MPLVDFRSREPDLFDAPEHGALEEFEGAFEGWLVAARKHRRIAQRSSEQAYRDVWGVLVRWCLSQDPIVTLGQLGTDDLELFLSSRSGAARAASELSDRYVWRVLHLIDRVLAHHAREQGCAANNAACSLLESRPEWRHANAAQRDPLPECLTAMQAKELVNFLSRARPRPGRRGAAHTWQELRNHAAVALQLGAGLAPGEIRALTLQAVVSSGGRHAGLPWKVRVPGDGVSPARESPIAQWAGHLVRHWLEVRAELRIAGDYLFPSTRTGKQWGKAAQYTAVKEVLEASGLEKHLVTGGSFRLRHTFALRQLRRGRSPDEVARWLGVVDPAVMARYQRVLSAPVDDVV